MEVLGFCKRVQHLLTYKFNHNGYTKVKKNIITPKKLQKKCKKSNFFVYVCDKEELDYGVPKEYVFSSLFEDFIRAYEQVDSEILDKKKDELELKEYDEVPKENSTSSLFVDCFDEFQQEIKTLDTKKEEVKLKEYEVPNEFLTSTLFGDFFDELEQDIEIEDTKKEELEWKKYEVPKEYLSSSWFKDFFRAYQQDITILIKGEELELSVTSCSVHDFECLLAMTKLQIYP